MTDMIEIQRAATADHIADLAREGAALRAERTRDQARERGSVHAEMLVGSADPSSARVRIGRWLVAIGEAIAGPARTPVAELGRSSQPCDDRTDQLERAA